MTSGAQTKRNVLNIYVSEGDDELPVQEFVSLLSDGLPADKYSETAIPAMHLIAAIVSSNWIERSNYFELVKSPSGDFRPDCRVF